MREDDLELAVKLMASLAEPIRAQPTQIIVAPVFYKRALRILYYKPPIKKVNGMRKKKRAYYWRKK